MPKNSQREFIEKYPGIFNPELDPIRTQKLKDYGTYDWFRKQGYTEHPYEYLPFVNDRPKDFQSFSEQTALRRGGNNPFITNYAPPYGLDPKNPEADFFRFEQRSNFRKPFDPAVNQATFGLSNIVGEKLLGLLNKPTTSGIPSDYPGYKIFGDQKFIGSGGSELQPNSMVDTFRALSRFVDPEVLNDLITRNQIPEYLRAVENRQALSGMLNTQGLLNTDFRNSLISNALRKQSIDIQRKAAKDAALSAILGDIPFGIGKIADASRG